MLSPALLPAEAGSGQPPSTRPDRSRGKRDLKLEQVTDGVADQDQARDLIKASGERVALVIGNSEYRGVGQLRNPRHDAQDVGELLKQYGFRVSLRTDLDLASFRESVEQFTAGLRSGSLAVFFFAGHGVQIDAENYLVPVDFRMVEEHAAKRAAIPASGIQAAMESANAGINILIFDACRNNPFREKANRRGLAPMDTRLGTLIAFATGPGQTADENVGGRNGLYTKHLLESLRMPLDLAGMFRKVRQDVHDASSGRQSPWFHEDILQAVYLKPTSVAAQSNEVAADLRDAQKLYLRQEYVAAAKAFETAVRAAPKDAYAQNALGVAYMGQGMFRQALERFHRAIQLKPDYRAAYYNRGLVHLRLPDYEAAEEDFSWALDESPLDSVLYKLRSRARLGSRKPEEAMADAERSLELNASDPETYVVRATIHNRNRRYREALSDSNTALSLRSGYCEALKTREYAHKALADSKGAAADAALLATRCAAQ